MSYRSEECRKHPSEQTIGACVGCAVHGCAQCLFTLPNAEHVCRDCARERRVKRTLPVFARPDLSVHRWLTSVRYFLATPGPLRWIWCDVDAASARGLLVLHLFLGVAVLLVAALVAPVREGMWVWLVVALPLSWITFQVALGAAIRRLTALPSAEVSVRLAFDQPFVVVPAALAVALGAFFPLVGVGVPLSVLFVAQRVAGLAGIGTALGVLLFLGLPLGGLAAVLLGFG